MLWAWIQLRQGVFDTTFCDKVCQWFAAGQWFSPGSPVSSTNKTDRHNIVEILLKVAFNFITITPCRVSIYFNSYIKELFFNLFTTYLHLKWSGVRIFVECIILFTVIWQGFKTNRRFLFWFFIPVKNNIFTLPYLGLHNAHPLLALKISRKKLVRVYNAHGLLKKIIVGNVRIKYQSYIFFSPLSMFHLLGEF